MNLGAVARFLPCDLDITGSIIGNRLST